MKTTFPTAALREIIYRDMKDHDKNAFKRDLKEKLKKTNTTNYALFEEIFENILDRHAPKKKKKQRVNHKPYVTKSNAESHYEIVRVINKTSYSVYRGKQKAFKKHKNFCNRLYKKERKKYHETLDFRKMSDCKKFWNTVKLLLSNKGTTSQKILSKEGNKFVTDDSEIAKI